MREKYLLLLIGCISCEQAKEIKQKNPEIYKESIQSRNIDGIYEYIYPDNTSDLIENQYIVLKNNIGLYYGTSDEFDEARAEYLPGFFVTQMRNLHISKDSIRFKLKITSADLFTEVVSLKFKESTNAKSAGHKRWEVKIPLEEKLYEGAVRGDTLYFKSEVPDFDKRFIKRK